MGVVLAKAELLADAGEFQVGWCPAQHATKSQLVISIINGEVDDEAHLAFARPDTLEWRLPRCWVDGATLTVRRDGVLLADPVDAVKAEFKWCAHHAKDSRQHQRAYQFWELIAPKQSMVGMWHRYGGMFPTDNVPTLLLCKYQRIEGMHIDVQPAGKCSHCGIACSTLRGHTLRDCRWLMAAMQAVGGAIVTISRRLCRPTVQITTTWGGVELHGQAATVNVRWMTPMMLENTVLDGYVREDLWPVCWGLLLTAMTAAVAQRLLTMPVETFMVHVIRVISEVLQGVPRFDWCHLELYQQTHTSLVAEALRWDACLLLTRPGPGAWLPDPLAVGVVCRCEVPGHAVLSPSGPRAVSGGLCLGAQLGRGLWAVGSRGINSGSAGWCTAGQ